jgi:hypothetical protein
MSVKNCLRSSFYKTGEYEFGYFYNFIWYVGFSVIILHLFSIWLTLFHRGVKYYLKAMAVLRWVKL